MYCHSEVSLILKALVFPPTCLWPFRKEYSNSYFFLFLLFSIECKKWTKFKVYFGLVFFFSTTFLLCYSTTIHTCSNSETVIRSALTYFFKDREVLKTLWHSKELCIKIKEEREDGRQRFLIWGGKKGEKKEKICLAFKLSLFLWKLK